MDKDINLDPEHIRQVKELVRTPPPPEKIVWPIPHPERPLPPYEKRVLYYLNQHGRQVILNEETAFGLHNKMKEFHGDQNGNMTLPRFYRRQITKKGQTYYE